MRYPTTMTFVSQYRTLLRILACAGCFVLPATAQFVDRGPRAEMQLGYAVLRQRIAQGLPIEGTYLGGSVTMGGVPSPG